MENKQKIIWIMIPLGLILFISTLDQTVTTTALHGIADSLGHSSQVSWILTIFLLTSAVTTLLFGKLGDIFGRKLMLQIALSIFLLGSLASGLAHSMLALILARGLQGLGAGGLNSLVQSITADVTPARSRGKYQGIFSMISMISLLLGPIIGGYFVAYIGWRWIFFINLPIGVIALLILTIKLNLPKPKRSEHLKIDYLGAILVTISTTLLLTALTLGGQQIAWPSVTMLILLGGCVVSLIGYVTVENKMQSNALTPIVLFKNKTFDNAILQFGLASAALFIGMVYVPLFAQTAYHVSAAHAGYYMTPILLSLIVAAIIAGIVIEKTGKYKLLLLFAGILIGVGFMGFASLNATSIRAMLILWQIPLGFGIGIFVNVSLLVGQNTVLAKNLGTATGVLNFFKTLGGALGSATFGAILVSRLDKGIFNAYDSVFLCGTLLAGGLILLVLLMKEEKLSEEVLAYDD